MTLPYLARALCLLLCGGGLLQPLLECVAWTLGPFVLRLQQPARKAERRLFLLVLAARALPWALALAFLVPAYLRAEDNRSAEHVSLVSAGFAAAVLLWSVAGLLRAMQSVHAARRCVRRSRLIPGTRFHHPPVLLYPGHPALIAVAGVFRPSILVSPALLAEGRFTPATLEVAFAHERAHAQHYDNLKSLVLASLPHLSFGTAAHSSPYGRWRLASELAADEEGTGGLPGSSLLLAGMLVSLAQQTTQLVPRGVTALHTESEHLRLRVECLLHRRPLSANHRRSPSARIFLGAALGVVILLGALCHLFGHRAAEFLFHGA